MHPDHLEYAQNALSTFIGSSIQRLTYSGDAVYRFSISSDDVKQALELERTVKSTVMEDYVRFFQSKGVQATFDPNFGAVDLVLNLNHVTLNPSQAEGLGNAMSQFRAERA